MKSSTFRWSHVAAALIVAIGLAALWGAVVGWTTVVAASRRHAESQAYESLQVALDGTPVIESRSFRNYMETSYRTLDGQPLPNQREEWLTAAHLPAPPKPSPLFESGPGWNSRVAGLSDSQRPPVAWYLIRNDRPIGRAYLVGYDEFSNLLVGYIGRGGFRPTMPPQSEWFDLGRRTLTHGTGALTASVPIAYGGRGSMYSYYSSGDQRVPAWHFFLIDGDRLQRIDLRERSVRTLMEPRGLVSVAMLDEAPRAENENAEAVRQLDADTEEADDATPAVAATGGTAPAKTVMRLAVRTADRIIIFDPPTNDQREFALPETLRDKPLDVYAVSNSQLLVMRRDAVSPFKLELTWLAMDSSVARREQVELYRFQGGSETEAMIIGVLAVPSPIAWLKGIFVGTPIVMLHSGEASTYSEAVDRALTIAGWPLVAVTLIAAALAGLTFRLQRKYHRPATGVWTTFVILLGVPGYLAYWIEHARPKMETCASCGTIVPRDREACAECNATFPDPPRVGTEIFA